MVTFDAADYASLPPAIQVNGIEGAARVGADGVHLDLVDGGHEHWPSIDELPMDRAVTEIVEALDGAPFSYDAELAVHTLEIIAAVHASHGRNGSFVNLPLAAEDRDLVVNSG